MQEIEQQSAEAEEIAMAERLQVFGSRLSMLATEQAQKRAQIEERWLKDLRQYHGKYTQEEQSRLSAAETSEIFVNITRNKANGAEARIQDMLFPTDDKNWAIQPTPVPEIEQLKQSPDPQQAQQAISAIRQAEEACEKMEEQIDDQLVESKYQAKARDMIHDAVVLGTGIIKGPVIVGRTKQRWDIMPDGTTVLSIEEDLAPAVEYVNVWDFYPDMSATRLSDCEFYFERHRYSKKQLREFAKLPGVMQSQLRSVIKAGKGEQLATDRMNDIRAITGVDTVSNHNGYELWEYHGPISKQELIDAMQSSGEPMEEQEIDELNDEVEAVVFFAGTRVLKVAVNPMDTAERPYSALCWEKDDASPFGFGVPYLMSAAQKVINASWRMLIDNAGQAVTDQIVFNEEIIEPVDGKWTMGPKKMWKLTDPARSVQEAFSVFETRSHQQEYANIIQMARQFADEETNMPLIAQGEQASHVTRTSSGMSMLMNSANIVLRRAVKNWDDDVTDPLISRFYDWNMQFNQKREIKGDFKVNARGSSALLVRDKQQENLMMFANLSMQNPELMLRRDWEGLDKEMAKALEVPYYNITLSDEDIQAKQQQMAQQQPPQDPMVQFKAQEMQLKQGELQLKAQELQAKQAFEQQKLQLDREIRMAELALRQNLTMAQLETKLKLEESRDRTNRETAAANIGLKRTETNLKAQNLAQGHDTYG